MLKTSIDTVIFSFYTVFMDFSVKLRAARAILKIDQHQMGDLLGVNFKTVANYENGETAPSEKIQQKIETALLRKGIRFTDKGVEQVAGTIFELKGAEGIRELLNMVYRSCLEFPEERVLVNNMRQDAFNKYMGEARDDFRSKFLAIPNLKTWHILLHEDDKDVFLPAYAEKRWSKDSEFGTVGQYCFGQNLALVFMDDECRIVVLQSPELKNTWELMFNNIWKLAERI